MRSVLYLVAFLVALPAHADPVRGLKIEHVNRKNRPVEISSPVRAGARALQFSVRDGQCAGNRYYNDCRGARERSEIVDRKPVRTEREQWYAFSLLIPKSTPHIEPAGTILAQFQDSKGSGEITLGFELWSEGLLLTQDDPRTRQTDDMAPPKPMVIKTIVPYSRARGRWLDFRIRAVWSAGDTGLIQVWLGDRLVHQHQGRNLNRNVAPTFKFGLYRTGLRKWRDRRTEPVPTQLVLFDEVARGDSAAEVAIR